MSAVWIGFIVYLALTLVVGLATYKLNETQEDFLLAGRKLNVWVATFSERASGESAWLLLGLPAAVVTLGLVEVWTAVGCVTGIVFAWFVVAEGLRRDTEATGALTLPEWLVRRHPDQAMRIRVVASAIILFFYGFYLAAQFNGAGTVLNLTFGIDKFTGIVIGATVIIAYTMLGGFLAVAWTDFLQAILMIGTLVILPTVGLWEMSQQDSLREVSEATRSWTGGASGLAAAAAVLSGLSWGFGYCGQPHTITRFMSIDRPEQVRVGRVIAFAWAAPAFAGALVIGWVGARLVDTGALTDVEQLMPHLATELLPGWLAGIFISGAVAAMMSTADSQLLVGTSSVAEDVVRRGFGVELSHRGMVKLSRLVTLGLGLGGFFLAVFSADLIFQLVSYAWSGLGSSFGPAILLTLYWRRTRGAGVVAGMATGAIVTVGWSALPANEFVHARLVSFVTALAVTVVVSLAAARRTRTGAGP
ncbi:MAG TPA: sodium/proline symporter [Myxococcales bacterium LLY-WYZ-16_1]|jgi:sodium/proline symporter|nr:sodium/proline symporter [Myxococcales bacterium LLY-WYZ-16_1]